MSGERTTIEVREREQFGSRDTRRLRKQGLVPGVLYGRGKATHAFVVPERDLRGALTGPSGLHAILDVVLAGQATVHPSILKEYQRDPIRGTVTHSICRRCASTSRFRPWSPWRSSARRRG